MRRHPARTFAACTAVVGLMTGCGGGGGVRAPMPTTAGTTSTATAAPTTAGSTTSSTAAPTTTTLVPTTTTVAVVPLASDPLMAAMLPAVDEYVLRTSDTTSTAPFEWLAQRSTAPGSDLGMDRYTVMTVEQAGDVVGTLVVLGLADDRDPTLEFEHRFLETMRVGLSRSMDGGVGKRTIRSIEQVAQVGGTSLEAIAWFHDRTGYVLWGESSHAVEDATDRLVIALHVLPPFDSIEAMEGTVLPGRFVDIGPGCGWAEDLITGDATMLRYGNNWRTNPIPLAAHFAMRLLTCEPTDGSTKRDLGQMSIVEMQDEFVEHDFVSFYLAAYKTNEIDHGTYIDGHEVIVYKTDAIRWFQDRYLYQLTSATTYDDEHPDGAPEFTVDQLLDVAARVIRASA